MQTSLRPSRPRTKAILFIAGFILLAAIGIGIWTGFGLFFAKSGELYQKGILRALNSTFQAKFVVVSAQGLNDDGYQILQASPEEDRSLIFTVSRTNGHVDGGLPLRRQLSSNYEEMAYQKYYPLLVQKYFGVTIQDVPMSIYWGTDSSRDLSDDNFIVVTRANLDDLASTAKAFFSEAESHRLKKLYVRFEDDLKFPSGDADNKPQRLELTGFDFKVGESWKRGYRPLTEEEIRQQLVSGIGRGIAERAASAFDAEYPDIKGNFSVRFTGNDLNSVEAVVSAHTITAAEREEALAEIYGAYTQAVSFISNLPLNVTAMNLKYETNTETETVTLKPEEWSTVNSHEALKELFEHSAKTENPR